MYIARLWKMYNKCKDLNWCKKIFKLTILPEKRGRHLIIKITLINGCNKGPFIFYKEGGAGGIF